MGRLFLVFTLFISFYSHADLFDFSSDGKRQSQIPALIEKLKSLDIKTGPNYDETFNLTVKAIENSVEEEKLYCSGESADPEGKTLPPSQKQLCMRELKKHYLEAQETIFDLKKKYLNYIHQKQVEKLTDIQTKLRNDIEKNF